MKPETEIVTEVALCLSDGRLNPAAVGWTRRPLHRCNLRGWGRNKRWEYWGIVSPTHIVGLTVSSLDYAGVQSLYVLDRRTGEEILREAVVPLARGVVLAQDAGGTAYAHLDGLHLDLDEVPGGTRIRARTDRIELDVVAARPDGHECLGVVVPWSERRFQLTVKDLGRPVSGRLVVDGERHELEAGTSFAVLDHGRGRWPYAITWNWGIGHGRVGDHEVSVQIGGRWTDGTGSTENALFVDGVAHKVSEDLSWGYDTADWMRPWRISGTRLDLSFHPFHERSARTNLLVVASEVHQCFGHYEGWASTDDGDRVLVDGIVGWAEEARNRW